MEEIDVQRVALDPLAAVEQPAQRPNGRVDLDAQEILERVDRGHLVGDRADPADARDDVQHLVRRPTDDQLLEVAGGLEDGELRLDDLAVADDQAERAFALHAGQAGDGEPLLDRGAGGAVRAVHQVSSAGLVATGGPPRVSMTSRNGWAYAVNPENSRAVSASGRPSRPNHWARLAAFARSLGPKQP